MADEKSVNFYLEEPLRTSAAKGEHNFINQVIAVLERSGFDVAFDALPIKGTPTSDHSISHMVSPPNEKGLMIRRVYHYPFWQIEAVAQRWHWDVAKAGFRPNEASPDAPRFYRFWQKRLFGDAPHNTSRDGFVYVPLQGKLDQRRLFQSCTPLEMIEHCLAHDPDRKVIAALHPKERYDRPELAKLTALERQHRNLTVDTGNMERHLRNCDYVVTQNSGAAFSGYFFGKPALLFGKIDFHHIAEVADKGALGNSFARVANHSPPYAKYIHWFWQEQSINAGRADVQDKIARRLLRFGWDIK